MKGKKYGQVGSGIWDKSFNFIGVGTSLPITAPFDLPGRTGGTASYLKRELWSPLPERRKGTTENRDLFFGCEDDGGL